MSAKRIDPTAMAQANAHIDLQLLEQYRELSSKLPPELVSSDLRYGLQQAFADRFPAAVGQHIRSEVKARFRG